LWTNVTVVSATITNGGGLVVPDDRQTLVYDLDGNLAFDGTWSYEWDGENRLKVMTMTDVVSIEKTNRLRLEFAYDYQGRRVQKIVSTNSTGSVFVPQSTNRFIYDGWNLLAGVTSDLGLLTSFTWGNDLSGTMGEAGGIGGLLLVTTHGSPGTNAFVAYGGNGNVTALVKEGSNPIAARYEYSPFGETLRITGPMAKVNPFRFSTKFVDGESGLIYYGSRYYNPVLGRWISRDPIDEADVLNLYNAFRNSPGSYYDPDGRLVVDITVSSLLQSFLRGGLIGGSVSAVAKAVFSKGRVNWSEVSKSFAKGFATGAITGITGNLMKAFAPAFAATGVRGEPTITAGLIMGGFNAGIGFAAGTWINGEDLSETLSTQQGRFGAAVAIGLGAALGATGVYAQENDWFGGATLDTALQVAGSFGGAAALEFYEVAETVRGIIGGYRDRISDQQ